VLAEISVAEGSGLALVLAAPRAADRRAIMPVLMDALAQQSRTDDLLARFGDAIGVLLPGARYEEACGYAARVAEALHRPAPEGISTSIDVGIALVYDEPYPDAAVLRRGRAALEAARRADDGLVALCEPEGMLLLDAVAVAALIAQDRAADEHAGRSSRRHGPHQPGS
jgi:GGDEF domain-containing protein